MTDSFTHCFKSQCPEQQWQRRARWWLIGALFLCAGLSGLFLPSFARAAQAVVADAGQLQLERGEDGLYLSTTLPLVLPELAQDALNKGIAMFFVAEAQVVRDRWYWSDRQVSEATRYMRLSYQPLTRRWRLNISPTPFTNTGLGVVLGQNFDDYDDALSAIARISRWKIAESGAIDEGGSHSVHFRFRLDMSQLPRPFQIGAVGRSGWNLLVSRSQRLSPELSR